MTDTDAAASGRRRGAILLVVTFLVLTGAGFYAFSSFQRLQDSRAAQPAVGVDTEGTPLPENPFVLFRNTDSGQGYGLAATVSMADPAGPRAIGTAPCDRVYGTRLNVVCLTANRGLVVNYEASIYDSGWQRLQSWALPGIPSRTRVSGDGELVATTVFVTGHSYAGTGFSTETVIRHTQENRSDAQNLEEFTLLVNGNQVMAADRNIWGVTFVPDQPDAFLATASSSGRQWLVRGSLAEKTLTAIHDEVECPSLSPDGTRVAYKKNIAPGPSPHWNIAVLDLASGQETLLTEKRNVDDQVEWLDDGSLLYGLPREGEAGDSDVWRIAAEAGSRPELYIEHASSPSVVR